MDDTSAISYTAFDGTVRIASGGLLTVARAAKRVIDAAPAAMVLVFEDATGRSIEIDQRGTWEEVARRLEAEHGPLDPETTHDAAPARGPGRPRLGVVAREVTLLPRHWDWLSTQPGGASVALRKLVEAARRTHREADRIRQSQEATYRFLTVMAGDLPGYEEATRALFAKDATRFEACTTEWPGDLVDHARHLADAALAAAPATL